MLVFGEVIGNKAFGRFGATFVFHHIWEFLRIVIPLISMIIIFALIYKLSPNPEEGLNIKFSHTLPGGQYLQLPDGF